MKTDRRTPASGVILTAAVMLLLSVLPQIQLWRARGSSWNGAYVMVQGDEALYAGYINALIDGRPRRSDPFGGRDSRDASPLAESHFSIQFVPSYVISTVARMAGVSASTAFIVLGAASAVLAALVVTWLIGLAVGDVAFAAAAALFVLCLGGLAGGHGVVGAWRGGDLSILGLPFLRRYQPAASFPLLFVFQALVWRALTSKRVPEARRLSLLAGLILGTLIFSYLYLWTAAAAWLCCIGAWWLYGRPSERGRTLGVLSIVGALAGLALIPYGYLLWYRAPTFDHHQAMTLTHAPDLFEVPEIVGALVLVVLVGRIFRGGIERSDPRVLLAASLATLPFVVFNQQVLTGRSIQVFHYAALVANYVVLCGVAITAFLALGERAREWRPWIVLVSALWGGFEVSATASAANIASASANDRAVPVLRELNRLAAEDGTIAGLRVGGDAKSLVFSPELRINTQLPLWAPQGTLLDVAGVDFGSITREERREFLLIHLYYSNATAATLRAGFAGRAEPGVSYYLRSAFLGPDRIWPALSGDFKRIETAEIEAQIGEYEKFAASFSSAQVARRPLSYAVIRATSVFDFAAIDRWYERDQGTRIEDYTLYRLKPRPQPGPPASLARP